MKNQIQDQSLLSGTRPTRRRVPRLFPLALPLGLIATVLGASVALACHVPPITGACAQDGRSISGVVSSSDGVATTITLDLQYQVGSTWTTAGTTTATFGSSNGTAGISAPYTMPFATHSGATAYRILYDGKNAKVANQSPPAAFTVASCSKPTVAALSRVSIRVVGTQHIVRWYSARQVLGFNVFAGQLQLNHRLITSASHWYTFATTHSMAGVRMVAVLPSGMSG